MAIFDLFEDTPFIASGHKNVDNLFSVIWVGLILSSIVIMAAHLRHAYTERQRYESARYRKVDFWPSTYRRREIWAFLAIALVALTLVTSLRFQHRRLKLADWASIEQWKREADAKDVAKAQGHAMLDSLVDFADKSVRA